MVYVSKDWTQEVRLPRTRSRNSPTRHEVIEQQQESRTTARIHNMGVVHLGAIKVIARRERKILDPHAGSNR